MRLESHSHVVPEGQLSPGSTFAHQTLGEERSQLVCGTLQDPTVLQLLKTKAPDGAPGEVWVCGSFPGLFFLLSSQENSLTPLSRDKVDIQGGDN